MAVVKPFLLMLIMGGILGGFLGVIGQKFAVKENPLIKEIAGMLPGYNCGACGNPGCEAMAKKLVNKEADITKCRPCKPEVRSEIAKVLESANSN